MERVVYNVEPLLAIKNCVVFVEIAQIAKFNLQLVDKTPCGDAVGGKRAVALSPCVVNRDVAKPPQVARRELLHSNHLACGVEYRCQKLIFDEQVSSCVIMSETIGRGSIHFPIDFADKVVAIAREAVAAVEVFNVGDVVPILGRG